MTAPKVRRIHLIAGVVLVLLAVALIFAFAGLYGRNGKRIELTGNEVYQLIPGAPVKLDGIDVGTVVEVKLRDGKPHIVVELKRDAEVEKAICRRSTEFSVARFINSELQWKDAQTVLHGSYLVAELGDPAVETTTEFTLRDEAPRDTRISWQSKRLTVLWPEVYGLSYAAPVLAHGTQVGCVDRIRTTPAGVEVTLAFFAGESQVASYVANSGKYYIKRFEGTNLEVRGVESLLRGSCVIVLGGNAEDPPHEKALGSLHSPPDPRITIKSPRCKVQFLNTFGLQVGAQILSDGRVVGSVEEIEPHPEGAVVHCVFFDSNGSYNLEGSRYYLSRFAAQRLEVQGVETALRGVQLVVLPGTGKNLVALHRGSLEMPPDPRVRVNAPRLVLRWTNTQGLAARAPVLWQGVHVGEVESIQEAGAGREHLVTLVFFSEDTKYRMATARYYINLASINSRGLQGEASTVLKGAHVDVVLDPLGTAAVVNDLRGFEGPPPRNLPEHGEAELVLNSPVWLEADSPLLNRRQVVGYVLRCERATDNRSYFATLRVYPRAQELVKHNSVFFLPPKVQASLFSRDGWSLRGPKLEVPDLHSFLMAGIEFRTPPEGGQAIRYSPAPRYELNLEPKPEWLIWQDDPAPAAQVIAAPSMVTAELSWRRGRIGFSTKASGQAVAIGNTLIGPKPFLAPELKANETEQNLYRNVFTVNGTGG
jgi:ABC-type transporter Mla subunit MlaD